MSKGPPRTMKTWERTPLACFFSTSQRAGKLPALPGVFEGTTFGLAHTTKDENSWELSVISHQPSAPTDH
jgi:hypothetical protein